MGEYWHNVLRGLWRERVFSILIVLIVSIGVAATTSMMVLLRTLGADPLPESSGRIVHPQLEPSVAGRPADPGHLPDTLTWTDAQNLLHAPAGKRKAIILEGQVTIQPASGASHAYFAKAIFTQGDFFPMFHAPFASGAAWSHAADEQGDRVVVLSKKMALQAFGTVQAIGRLFTISDHVYRVVGILDAWHPSPRFYDLANGPFADQEDVYLPLRTAVDNAIEPTTSPECWGEAMPDLSNLDSAPCTWVDLWVELGATEPREGYLRFLTNYSEQQRAVGRFYRAPHAALPDIREWLDQHNVVPGIAKLQALIAYSFLGICIFNAAALLLIMLLRRRKELGLRRALGATRKRLITDLVMEHSGLAIASAVGGCLAAWACIRLLRTRPEAYYAVIHADPWMVFVGVSTAIVSIMLATLLPAWHVIRANPYSMLRS